MLKLKNILLEQSNRYIPKKGLPSIKDIKELQKVFFYDSYSHTGKFDKKTKAYLKAWQETVGLSPTGNYGPQSESKMKELNGTWGKIDGLTVRGDNGTGEHRLPGELKNLGNNYLRKEKNIYIDKDSPEAKKEKEKQKKTTGSKEWSGEFDDKTGTKIYKTVKWPECKPGEWIILKACDALQWIGFTIVEDRYGQRSWNDAYGSALTKISLKYLDGSCWWKPCGYKHQVFWKGPSSSNPYSNESRLQILSYPTTAPFALTYEQTTQLRKQFGIKDLTAGPSTDCSTKKILKFNVVGENKYPKIVGKKRQEDYNVDYKYGK